VNWLRAETGWMRVHLISGYAVLAALLFRLIWGFLGSDTARFSAFLASPLAALRLLGHMTRREHDTQIGHNAAAGSMVLLLLAPLAVQAGTGLFANTFDDYDVNSAFAALVSRADSDWPSELSFVAASFMFAAAFSKPARSDQISGFAFVLLPVSLPSGNRNQLAPMPLTVLAPGPSRLGASRSRPVPPPFGPRTRGRRQPRLGLRQQRPAIPSTLWTFLDFPIWRVRHRSGQSGQESS
jgi:hypothetical protein